MALPDNQKLEGDTLPSSPYPGQDFWLTKANSVGGVTVDPGHVVFIPGATPTWAPFAGGAKIPPGTPT